jgi:hypothetical protein
MLRLRWLLVILLAAVPASAEYKLFLRQTAGLWQDAEKWLHCTLPPCGADASSDNYSILDQLETCRSGGVFVFKTLWPKGDIAKAEPSHNIWRQSSNPLKVGPTEGYVPIDVQRTEHGFGGLTYGMSKGNTNTQLCNNCDSGNWWHALGSVQGPCGAKFPGADCTEVVELWVECGSDWGWSFLGALLGVGGLYVVAPIALATRTRGADRSLSAHPHYAQWMDVKAMVHDGVAFARGGGGGKGGGGYRPIPREAAGAGPDDGDDEGKEESSRGGGRSGGKQKRSSSGSSRKSSSSKSKSGGGDRSRDRDRKDGKKSSSSSSKDAAADADAAPAAPAAAAPAAAVPAKPKASGYRGDEWVPPKVVLAAGARETGAKVKY